MQLDEKIFTEPLAKFQGWRLIDNQRVLEITTAYFGFSIYLEMVDPCTLFGTLGVTVVVFELDPENLRFFCKRHIIQVKRVFLLIQRGTVISIDVNALHVLKQPQLHLELNVVNNLDRFFTVKFHVALLLGKRVRHG